MTSIKPIKIAARAHPDGEGILLTIGTKYAGETTYAISPELLEGLRGDLQRLNAQTAASPRQAPTTTANQAADPTATTPTRVNQIAVRAPKKWMLGNGLPNHPMVVFIVDPQTDQQAGYAFDAKAAREMAVNLVKNADAIEAHGAKKQR
jgi:hypothetical protein